MSNKKDSINDASTEMVNTIGGALSNPKKFYFLLLLSGFSASKAQDLMYDLKYPKLRMASTAARKKVINLLISLIDIITGDSMLYARFRTLSKKGILGEDSGMSTASLPNVGLGNPDVQSDPPFGAIPGILNFLKKRKRNKTPGMDPVIFADHMLRRA